MKKIVALILATSMVFALCGCGSNEDKEKLCEGVWVNHNKSSGPLGPYAYWNIYDFSANGSFTYSEYRITLGHLLDDEYHGTYKMDTNKHEIILTYNKDENGEQRASETIPYYINEYTHELVFKPNAEGKSYYSNRSSIESIDFSM